MPFALPLLHECKISEGKTNSCHGKRLALWISGAPPRALLAWLVGLDELHQNFVALDFI